MMNALIVLADEHFTAGRKNVFSAIAPNSFFCLYFSDERFSAGDKRIESARSNFHPTQLHM